ncbi:1-deoxy-D-xylulose-5-phosphate synthase [Natronoglycomyces albus]|uniref:1-deoxy-D-xylulose-5-phosphate synthase n=1 Tax=Natronoglycomyces albus TaxID=2811108 RepID=A0A895XSV2_9ACTN|nr:1-deoxy-D-xylulose-5-phosphate synthase [Natronoglycomyces albus]QSB06399.1 1-deoxy-D-xylulose-5-phosphate synthase [Natronoglycomyces albus]
MSRFEPDRNEPLLPSLSSLAEYKRLPDEALPQLAEEIRDFLVTKVAQTGGHIGPNLGVVELTMAIHRVFDSPIDKVVFDTGHQSYVHKILTGRAPDFDQLRQRDGLAGYPSQAESPHDLVENSHASTSLSYADGLAKAFALKGERNRHVVAVVGDGALTGGMCWEALNNIAAQDDLQLIIVVNDNGRSYAPTIGGLAKHLTAMRLNPSYERSLDTIKETLGKTPYVGGPIYEVLHAMKRGVKDALAPQGLFEDLGLKYVGPADGHNLDDLTEALWQAKKFGGPVIVHAITQKGNGWDPAVSNESDQMHQSASYDPATGQATGPKQRKWTKVFSEALVAEAEERQELVGITAAMAGPTGIEALQKVHPDRVFDVGIAEQHAVTSAAGLAMAGLHPVVAIYSTFMNRAFDQTLLDVAMHGLPVTFALDRSGITGPDGPSHYGIWDMSIFRVIPGMQIAAPRDESTMRQLFSEALDIDDGPSMVRFPTGAVPAEDLVAVSTREGVDILRDGGANADILLVGAGIMAHSAMAAAERISSRGFTVTVVDPRWVAPVPAVLTQMASEHRLVATIEDGIRSGGLGDALARELRDAQVNVPLVDNGVESGWHPHGTRQQLLEDLGLTVEAIAERITEAALKLPSGQ